MNKQVSLTVFGRVKRGKYLLAKKNKSTKYLKQCPLDKQDQRGDV